MNESPEAASVLRFGTFELDLTAGQLRKAGLRVRLQEQPFRLLALLAQRPGEVLGREELREKLWPADTYVDFDNSLNTAASKLREALGDSAASPRFIETLPRRGYRFLASIQRVGEPGAHDGEAPASPNASSPQVLGPEDAAAESNFRNRWLRGAVIASVAVLAVVAAAVLAWQPSTATNELNSRSTKFSVAPGMEAQHAAISPDGRRVVFSQSVNPYINPARSRPEQGATLWVQGFDEWEPSALEGTQGAWEPFWSPDSQWIAFFQGDELKKISTEGGAIIVLCRAPTFASFGAWSPTGSSIFFADGLESRRLYRVPAQGGEPEVVFDPGEDIEAVSPLPVESGRQALLYSVPSGIGAVDVGTGEHRVFISGFGPVYSTTGHVLFQASRFISGIRAVPFSLETLRPSGEPFPVAQEAWSSSVSKDGTLVYIHSPEEDVQLAWRNRNGDKLTAIGGPHRTLRYPLLSPDERHIAFSAVEGNSAAVWTHDIARSVTTRIAHSSENDLCPLWSPSGDEIVFSSWRDGNADIFLKRADGGGEAIPVVATEWKEFATDWSSDGRYIFYDRNRGDERNEVWYLELGEEGRFEPSPFLTGEPDQRAARLSPDGKYLAYVSDETGSHEVWVTTFPEPGRKWKVSSGGGMQPLWGKSAKELYYVNDYTLHAVTVNDEGGLALGIPQPLFRSIGFGGSMAPRYDVSADGRFLVREPVSYAPSAIRVVQNWFAEFRDP